MSEPRTRTSRPRGRQVGRGASRRPSPGIATSGLETDDERMLELEARLARLEASPGLRERGRSMFGRVVPGEALRHFRNAGREQLLGVRTIVDFWIRRIDAMEAMSEREAADRETIEID
jgi:hypothetical protein